MSEKVSKFKYFVGLLNSDGNDFDAGFVCKNDPDMLDARDHLKNILSRKLDSRSVEFGYLGIVIAPLSNFDWDRYFIDQFIYVPVYGHEYLEPRKKKQTKIENIYPVIIKTQTPVPNFSQDKAYLTIDTKYGVSAEFTAFPKI